MKKRKFCTESLVTIALLRKTQIVRLSGRTKDCRTGLLHLQSETLRMGTRQHWLLYGLSAQSTR